ncbi:hydroxyacid dehydrogenase [Streptomyces sp. CA2R106]|uniref:hydroxyacid dehydrogenase n=1 Tax=Streptomyces sp. CA2R106 TaxID=3120153 RepID=UPI003FA78E7C
MPVPRVPSTPAASGRPRAVLAMDPQFADGFFDDRARARFAEIAVWDPALIVHDLDDRRAAAELRDAEVMFASWGAPVLDEELLAAAPALKAVVYAAGSVKGLVTEACWRRGLTVSSGAWANALPVAEYTVAAILLANKQIPQIREEFRRVRGTRHAWRHSYPDIGNYRRTVGIVGASLIGRRVIELLRPHDLAVVVHDPYLDPQAAGELGVRTAALDELCAVSDVVSLHAPQLPATEGMIGARQLALMRDGATLVNTARGALVDTAALVPEVTLGRLNAVLDVTDPDPLPAGSPLYDLPNVTLTPHVAGSMGNEHYRLAHSALDELARYAAGRPFRHEVRPDRLDRIA